MGGYRDEVSKLQRYKDPLLVLKVKMTNLAKKETHYQAFADDITEICTKLQEFLEQVQTDVNEFHGMDSLEAHGANFQHRVGYFLESDLDLTNFQAL